MSKELTENENTLLRTAAYWLRGEMVLRLADASPSQELLHDSAQSNFEISCDALERVGLFISEGDYWRVKDSKNDHSVFAGQHTRSDLDHLLDGFACHSSYVRDLYRHHEAVTPTNNALRDVCLAMVKCGYMECISPKAFEWTDEFGPWLVRHGAWRLDEFEAASQADVDRVLATIPADAKERLSSSTCGDSPNFVRCFFAQWIDGKWEDGEWRLAPNDDWDICLAAALYAELHGK
ncbi:hypothetical protein [Halocynthiibacter sp.]|uniref:hypothetical protein n=1 Tax=Halocynthiibacter sp. TaxID=1979210 RepID=UPI003C602A2C